MTFEEAKQFLAEAVRGELRDHAFGDCEVTWEKDGKVVGFGYFGGAKPGVTVFPEGDGQDEEDGKKKPSFEFEGNEAHELRKCGKLEVERNDSTGPDTYREGATMPGLTREGVLAELTTPKGIDLSAVKEDDNMALYLMDAKGYHGGPTRIRGKVKAIGEAVRNAKKAHTVRLCDSGDNMALNIVEGRVTHPKKGDLRHDIFQLLAGLEIIS